MSDTKDWANRLADKSMTTRGDVARAEKDTQEYVDAAIDSMRASMDAELNSFRENLAANMQSFQGALDTYRRDELRFRPLVQIRWTERARRVWKWVRDIPARARGRAELERLLNPAAPQIPAPSVGDWPADLEGNEP